MSTVNSIERTRSAVGSSGSIYCPSTASLPTAKQVFKSVKRAEKAERKEAKRRKAEMILELKLRIIDLQTACEHAAGDIKMALAALPDLPLNIPQRILTPAMERLRAIASATLPAGNVTDAL